MHRRGKKVGRQENKRGEDVEEKERVGREREGKRTQIARIRQ
jgi:hypothetical protein